MNTPIDFKALIENRSCGVIIVDRHDNIQFANASARSLFRSLEEDPIGKDIWSKLPGGLLNDYNLNFIRARETQQELHFVSQYQNPMTKWMESCICPEGEWLSILFRDITSQCEVESKIEESHKKLVLLAEAANHILFNEEPKKILDSLFKDLADYLDLDVYFNYIYDKDTQKLRLMNYAGITAAQAQEIKWQAFGESICGSVAAARTRIIAEHIQESEQDQVRLLRSFGIKAYACHPLLSYGKLIGTLSFGSSQRSTFGPEELKLLETICNQFAKALERSLHITELKNKNNELSINYKKLSESEAKVQNIINGAMDGIILLDSNQFIVEANPSACNILGEKKEHILSQNVTKYIKLDNFGKGIHEINAYLKSGAEKVFEYTVTKDIIPEHQLIIFRDITTKKKVEAALIAAKEHAEKESKSKTEFLSKMSHELRTPLNSILGYTQILLDDNLNKLNDLQKERTIKIYKSGRHLVNLINDILDHSQIESGKVKLHIEAVQLKPIIEEAINMFHPTETKGITIENKLTIQDDLYVRGDLTRIKQIMINLLTNAVKYNKPNGKIIIRSEFTKSSLKILIQDTGIGIPEDYFKLIFEPFYRIDHPEYNIEGTGIGLTLVKSFITMMGGSVGVTSQVNEGSCFWFSLLLIKPNGGPRDE